MKKTDNTSLIYDLSLFSKDKGSLLALLKKWLKEQKELGVVYTPNPEQIIQSRGNKQFLAALQKADFLLPDGVGLVAASKFLAVFNRAKPLSGRIAGVEIVEDLLELAHQQGLKVLVIGGRNYSPGEYFAYKGAKINCTPGFNDVATPTLIEKRQLEAKIGEIRPDLVFVAFGAPAQELWIEQHRSLLENSGVRMAMAVGGSFDFLLGKTPRAPYWFRKLGLEWLFRLIVEPWRLKRQLRLISFISLTVRELFI